MLQVPCGPGVELPAYQALADPLRTSHYAPHKQERRLHRLPQIDVRQQQEHALQLDLNHSSNQIDLRSDVELTLNLLLQVQTTRFLQIPDIL